MRLLLTVFALFEVILCLGQVTSLPYVQDFEGDPIGADGWESNIIGGSVNWEIVSSPTSCSESVSMINSFAFICSGGSGNQQAELISNIFDLSDYENIVISFEHRYKNYSSDEEATFSYSIDGGANWINVETWNSFNNPDGALQTFSSSFPILGGESNVRFRWHYHSPSSWDWYWAIDDFEILGDELPECIGNPAAGVVTLNVNDAPCAGANVELLLNSSGYTAAGFSGRIVQWQYSLDGTTGWTDISGENNPASLVYVAQSNLFFRLMVECSISGEIDYSNVVEYSPISCDSYQINAHSTVTSCDGALFYDSGGPIGDYSNSEDETIIFCSDDGSFVRARFTEFNTQTNDLYGVDEVRNDILYVYDGNTVGTNPMFVLAGVQDADDQVPVITSNSDCLTFRFVSDGSDVRSGWEALISCTDQPNNVATNFCETAPNICNLNGYRTTTSNFYNPETVGGQIQTCSSCLFPDGVLDNNAFISFVPTDSEVELELVIENCRGGLTSASGFYEGVQFALYEGSNCSGLSRLSSYDDVYWGITPGIHTRTYTGLTPGDSYYIMTDGLFASVCDLQININTGLELPELAENFFEICDGGSATFVASGADSYLWDGPGVTGETTNEVTVSQAGVYTVDMSVGRPECPDVIRESALLSVQVCGPLPVTMGEINVTCLNNQVVLTWETLSEQNANTFIVEKSSNGTDWEFRGELDAGGNTAWKTNYRFVDKNVDDGVSYYRLRQVDFDGAEEVFGPLSANCKSPEEVIIFPNPTSDFVEIKSGENSSIQEIHFFTNDGKKVQSELLEDQKQRLKLDVGNLQKGVYIIEIKTVTNEGEYTSSKKLIKI